MSELDRRSRRFQVGVASSLLVSILVVVGALLQAAGSLQSFY